MTHNFPEPRVRLFILAAVVVAVAACSSSNTPTGTKPPPTTASFDTLSKGSIPPTGGTITVSKAGDPLNGLTLTVPSGAFSGTLNVTIGSTSNKNLPTANGIVPISPVVHVVTSAGGYTKGTAITFKIPATVAAKTFPVVVLYDSATKTIEPMTTIAYDGSSVTAITGHLSQPGVLSASAARVAGRSRPMAGGAAAGAQSDSLFIAFGVYAIPYSVLNQDWDTHFRPGINDWEMPFVATEATQGTPRLGVATTELWYFNSGASSTPLNGRFAAVHNASLSDTIGFHWTSAIDNQVSNQVNSYLSSAYKSVTNGAAGGDSLQFDQIRASFALPTLNGGKPLPVLVDLQDYAIQGWYYLIAYRATGNQIYVADPVSPGDSSLFLQLGSNGMTPYVNPSYKPGLAFTSPLATPLGMAIPLAPLASSYADAAAGTVGTSLFPTSGFYSWSGQLYDTMYVVDSLRFWAQCATCQYGFASTLSPAPSGNVESSFNIYLLSGGLVTDSIGYLGSNGLLVSKASLTPGMQKTLGVPLASAKTTGTVPSSSAWRWLDWHQFTIANLQGTVAFPTGGVLVNEQDTLQVSFQPDLLPADVAYEWDFGDSTPKVTVQKNPAVHHSYAKAGTLTTTVKVIDNRNSQVIARVDTTLNSSNVELWRIQSFTWLHTLVNGAISDSAKATLAFQIPPNTVPTLIALNGPPFPGGNYPFAGFGFVAPPDSAQQWAQVKPIPLAISAAFPPIDVFEYTNTGTATSGTISGKAMIANDNGITNYGFTANLTKKGPMLSGYITLQGTSTKTGFVVVVDTIVAVRVP
jgi:hypothetical protein